MQYRTLGTSGEKISLIGLGTMTWGQQNTQAEAFAQMDYALGEGVNFWDTAELYSIPPRAETQGSTERIIGNYFAKQGGRNKVFLASKITGPALWVEHIRQGKSRFNAATLTQALDASLQRLQTEYVDLYQLHWPERKTNYFGRLGFAGMENEGDWTPFEEVLTALGKLIAAGKIRYIGLSNETPWGVMRCLALSEFQNLPRIQSVQNPYSLLNRSYEVGLAEISQREDVGLLAYSPLGFGVLSGKYLHNPKPANGRISLFPHYNRYSNAQAVAATAAYVDLAKNLNISAAHLALAFVNQQPFVASNIIGATTLQQLQENIQSVQVKLSAETLAAIEAIHQKYTIPSP